MTGDRAVSEVVQDILDDVQELLHAEVRLAKAEVRQDARQAAVSGVWLTGGRSGGRQRLDVDAVGGGVRPGERHAALGRDAHLWVWSSERQLAPWPRSAGGGLKRLQPLLERSAASVKENLEWLKQSTR